MQSPPKAPTLGKENSTGLQFPTIPDEYNILSWLDQSDLIEAILQGNMASQTDDSSVDETLSSVGDSTWDMIDEGSVASEDAARTQSRGANRPGEGMESVHVTNESFTRASEVRSTTTEDSDLEDLIPARASNEGVESPEATPVGFGPKMTVDISYGVDSSHTQDLLGTIRVDDKPNRKPVQGVKRASVEACTFGEQESRKALSRRDDPGDVQLISGRVHLSLKDGGLEVKDTFKLLYYGPREMKSAITQKIGSALAANPRRPLINDGPGSSRVTVVPISSFVDESSPEVVMIESGGFDMIIEECIGARLNDSGGISLDVESGNTIEQWIDHNDGLRNLEVSAPTGVPDLGIIYLPEKSYSLRRLNEEITSQNAYYAQLFFQRLGVPSYVITDIDWLDDPRMATVGSLELVPHRSIEALVNGKKKTWSKIPIDITTFLALDASQLHQNLVALKKTSVEKDCLPFATPSLVARAQECSIWLAKHTRDALTVAEAIPLRTWLAIATMLVASLVIPMMVHFEDYGLRNAFETSPATCESQDTDTVLSILAGVQYHRSQALQSMTGKNLNVVPTNKALASLFTAETQRATPLPRKQQRKENTGVLPKGKSSEKHDVVVVQIVGQSSVLVRAVHLVAGRGSLNVDTERNGKPLKPQIQRLDDEYILLDIPAEEAYGLIEIRIWTSPKPRYNETFEINLGFPWLKPKGWIELAEDAADKTKDEISNLQIGLWKALDRGSATAKDIRQSKTVARTLENLSVSMGKVEHAIQSGSAKLLRRSIRRSLRVQKKLSKLMRRLQHSGTKQSHIVLEQQARLNADLKELVLQVSETLFSQRRRLEKAFEVLRATADPHRLTALHRPRVRTVQKKLLHAWWKVRGRPEHSKNEGTAARDE